MSDDGSWGHLRFGQAVRSEDPEIISGKWQVVPSLQGRGWKDQGEGSRPIAGQCL